jgi:heme/copper-type cytochrome/quinol oxidase subunit 2
MAQRRSDEPQRSCLAAFAHLELGGRFFRPIAGLLRRLSRVYVPALMAGAITGVAYASPFDPASPQASAIRDLFASALVLCGAVFLLVTCLIAYCAVRFRARGAREPQQVEGNKRLEIAWTLAPILALVWRLSLTVRAMGASDPPIDRDPDVTIIGHQWWWEARYPSGVVTASEIHVPTGKALVVRLESSDVIHDFWVPELGRKNDAIPGRTGNIWLQADRPGEYRRRLRRILRHAARLDAHPGRRGNA